MKLKLKQNKLLLKTAKWTLIGGFVADAALLCAGYYSYHQLKNSTEFRHKVYNYDSRFIDMYYRANEKYGDGKARQFDYQKWGIEKVESFSFVHLFGL